MGENNWIKMAVRPDDPEILRLAELTGVNPERVYVMVTRWFFHVADHYRNGQTGIGPASFNRIVGWQPGDSRGGGPRARPPLVQALSDPYIRWLTTAEDGTLVVPKFDKFFGALARRRAEDQRRKQIARCVPDDRDGPSGEVNPQPVRKLSAVCPQVVRSRADVDRDQDREEENSIKPPPPPPEATVGSVFADGRVEERADGEDKPMGGLDRIQASAVLRGVGVNRATVARLMDLPGLTLVEVRRRIEAGRRLQGEGRIKKSLAAWVVASIRDEYALRDPVPVGQKTLEDFRRSEVLRRERIEREKSLLAQEQRSFADWFYVLPAEDRADLIRRAEDRNARLGGERTAAPDRPEESVAWRALILDAGRHVETSKRQNVETSKI